MTTVMDKEAIHVAYEEVRSDLTDTNWAVFKYESNCIVHCASGVEFEDLKAQFGDDDRAFAFIRMRVGDEMSKRMKFALITFIGPNVGPIKRAKMSTDKGLVKAVVSNFAVELQAESQDDVDETKLAELIVKAGGANYGSAS